MSLASCKRNFRALSPDFPQAKLGSPPPCRTAPLPGCSHSSSPPRSSPLHAAPKITIQGTIRDSAGNPVPGLVLELYSEPYRDPGWSVDSPVTGLDGRIVSMPESHTGPRLKSDRYARARTTPNGTCRLVFKPRHNDRAVELRLRGFSANTQEIRLTGAVIERDVVLPAAAP